MLVIFPLLGIDAFDSAAGQARVESATEQTKPIELYLDERGVKARGREVADGFVVLEGSLARASEVESIHDRMRELRLQLQERGVLVADGEQSRFAQDLRFTSPSLADVMTMQVRRSPLDYRLWDENRDAYFAAIQAGMDCDYEPMKKLVSGALAV